MNRKTRLVTKTPLERKTPMKQGGKIKAKPRTKKQRAALDLQKEFKDLHTACAICWATRSRLDAGLQLHHIMKGRGRKDFFYNYLVLCQRCHDQLHAGGQEDDDGNQLPDLTDGMMFTAKRECDIENYDLAAMAALKGYAPTALDPLPIPQAFLDMRERA